MRTLKDINWNQVYSFYEVARKLSMKEAGQLLGVSTPTISEQIKKLEELLGVPLFKRFPRKIELTNEGASLYACAKEMFEAGGRFLDTVSPDSIGGYSVKVAIQETTTAPIAIEFLNQYWDLFAPFGTVNTVREVTSESIVEKLVQGKYDWGISIEKPRSSRLSSYEIATSKLVFCCSARIFKKFKQPADILRSIPIARNSWDSALNETVDDVLRESSIFPEEIIESDHLEFIINLAQRGRCVALLPQESIKNDSWGKSLTTFELNKPIKAKIFAVWPKGSEKMISIKKLIELVNMTGKPAVMLDPELQIKVGEVKQTMLE